jgi:hypothetical protein
VQQMREQAKTFVVEDMTVEHMITGVDSKGPGDAQMYSPQVLHASRDQL